MNKWVFLAVFLVFCNGVFSLDLTPIFSDASETGTNGGHWFLSGSDCSSYSYCEFNATIYSPQNYLKIRWDSTADTHGDENVFYESGVFKNEPNYATLLGSFANGSVLTVQINYTANTTTICDDGACAAPYSFTNDAQNAWSVEWGGNGALITLADVSVSVLTDEYSAPPTATPYVIVTTQTSSISSYQNTTFTVSVNLSCFNGTCGDVNIYLDPVDPEDTNAENETWAQYYAEYLSAFSHSGNLSVAIGEYTAVPWYSSSSECGNAQLQDQCSFVEDDNKNTFCSVTDETSQVFLMHSMAQDGDYDSMIDGFLNLIADIAVGVYGVLTDWKYGFNGGALITSEVSDCASDADARFITAAAISATNTNLNVSVRAKASAYLDSACPDFVKYTVWDKRGDGETVGVVGGTFRDVDFYSTGGCNVGTNGDFAWGNTFYTGYFGDNTQAMISCYAHTGNITYLHVAQNTTQLYLAVANWTTDTGFRVPDGKEFGLDGGVAGARQPSCDVSCGNWEDADAVRAVSLCSAGYFADALNVTLHPELAEYCEEWTQATGYNTTMYARQRTPSGGYIGDYSNSYENNGLALYLDIYANEANLETRMNALDVKFTDNTNSWNGNACFGTYWSAFAVTASGYALGYADATYSSDAIPQNKGGIISNTTGATPFWVTSENPKSCTLTNQSSCLVSWTVNATGDYGSYVFFAIINGTNITQIYSSTWTQSIIQQLPDIPPVIPESTASVCQNIENMYVNFARLLPILSIIIFALIALGLIGYMSYVAYGVSEGIDIETVKMPLALFVGVIGIGGVTFAICLLIIQAVC